MDRTYWVYLLASGRNGTLYTGVTNDISRRAFEHREGIVAGFTKRHAVKRLVWFELHDNIDEAIAREKRVKRWKRAWKLALIEKDNPEWDDLYPTLA